MSIVYWYAGINSHDMIVYVSLIFVHCLTLYIFEKSIKILLNKVFVRGKILSQL